MFAKAEGKLVYVVPVEQEIERGLQKFLERAFGEAEKANADVIILEINTLGGAVDAAIDIGTLLQQEKTPVIAFIKGEAISAGSYIALSADKIYMQPNSHIGAAAVRTITGEEADPKITSFWASHMRGAAKQQNKNPEIAEGMVDPNIEIQGITKKGQLITLDSESARKTGIADGIVNDREQLLNKLDLDQANIVSVQLSLGEKLARFVTNPIIMSMLLIVGIAGILIEIFVPGFGLFGIVGVTSFGLYFFGHLFAGFAGWEHIILFLVGIVLILLEIFIPGGIVGAIGSIMLSSGIVLAAYKTSYGIFSLVIAIIVNSILLYVLIKYFGHRGVWKRLILNEEQKKESGYVSHNKDKKLIGNKGVTLSKLRPSGIAVIDGLRYDVISQGEWIEENKEIRVIMVEGTRIVVQEEKI